jgi:hypothetical protein
MPKPGTQSSGTTSRRGILSEGRPTKKTAEMVARLAEATSFGLTDEETSALVRIEPDTLRAWKDDPAFFGAIKSAISARLKRIERGKAGWQGTAWILERTLAHRYAKPELQIALNNTPENNPGDITISFDINRARELQAEVEPIQAEVVRC